MVARNARPGEAAEKKEECPGCEGLRRRRIRGVLQLCSDCEGLGYRMVDPFTGRRPLTVDRDPGPLTGSERAAAWHLEDAKLAQTEAIIRQHEGKESAGDTFTTAVDRRDRFDEAGSFAELRAALEQLRDQNPAASNLAVQVGMYGVGIATEGELRDAFEMCCEVLAYWMPERIRVPGFLRAPVDPAARKKSLHRGRTEAHTAERDRRDLEVVDALAGGEGVEEVAARYRLTPQWVRELRRRASARTVGDEASAKVGPPGQDPARPEPAQHGGFPRSQGAM
jgi:hypothetical protein